MLPTIFDSTTVPVLQEVATFTEARHNVLAGNIANLHTPGYRVRDLSVENFQARLKEAISTKPERAEYPSPGPLGLEPREPADAMRNVRESLHSILYHDDTNIGLEQQVAEISKNQFLHNLAISIMSSQFRMLQVAISERV